MVPYDNGDILIDEQMYSNGTWYPYDSAGILIDGLIDMNGTWSFTIVLKY